MKKCLPSILLLIGASAVFVSFARDGQAQDISLATPNQSVKSIKQKSVEELIADLRKNPRNLQIVRRLRQMGDTSGLPILKEAFTSASAKSEKQQIASAMVLLGETDVSFLDYLFANANEAAKSDMPYPLAFNAEGRALNDKLGKEFLDWCERHQIPIKIASQNALISLPADIMAIAALADHRCLEVLRRGLESPNFLVAAVSAQGLAALQDEASIQPIIRAAKRAPTDAGETIARALVFFADPQAQTAFDELVKREGVRDGLRKLAKEKGFKALFEEQ